jgi:hypothetical protein
MHPTVSRLLVKERGNLPPLICAVKLLNRAIYNRLMECLITSLCFELFENIIHMKLHGTLTNNEALSNAAIAKRFAEALRDVPFGSLKKLPLRLYAD